MINMSEIFLMSAKNSRNIFRLDFLNKPAHHILL